MKVANQFAPYAVIDPERLRQYKEENRAWQGAPSIARTKGGRLFVGFMSGGIYEPDPRNHCLFVYSDDNGESWSDPFMVIESSPEARIRRFEPEFWLDPNGRLWLFWVDVPYPAGLGMPTYEQKIDMENDSEYHTLESHSQTWCSVCEDPDADELVWSKPRYLFNAVMRNTPLVTKSGRWLFPTYLTSPRDYYEFHYSDDEGKTFRTAKRTGRAVSRAYDEPSFYHTSDGRIAAIVRTTPPMYKRIFSADEGLTWSEPEDFLETSSQRPCTRNLADGSVVFIPSIHKKSRNGFRLLHAKDGLDFSEVLVLDDRERISYAEAVEGEDGTLYIAYDRERNNKIRKSRVTGYSEAAKEILFARIPRKVLETGEITHDTVRARIITKARINTLDNIYTI